MGSQSSRHATRQKRAGTGQTYSFEGRAGSASRRGGPVPARSTLVRGARRGRRLFIPRPGFALRAALWSILLLMAAAVLAASSARSGTPGLALSWAPGDTVRVVARWLPSPASDVLYRTRWATAPARQGFPLSKPGRQHLADTIYVPAPPGGDSLRVDFAVWTVRSWNERPSPDTSRVSRWFRRADVAPPGPGPATLDTATAREISAIEISTELLTGAHWPAGMGNFRPGTDTVTVCAWVTDRTPAGDVLYRGDRAVLVAFLNRGDSLSWAERPERGAELAGVCEGPTAVPSWPVSWHVARFRRAPDDSLFLPHPVPGPRVTRDSHPNEPTGRRTGVSSGAVRRASLPDAATGTLAPVGAAIPAGVTRRAPKGTRTRASARHGAVSMQRSGGGVTPRPGSRLERSERRPLRRRVRAALAVLLGSADVDRWSGHVRPRGRAS